MLFLNIFILQLMTEARRIRVGERCLLDEDMHTEFKMHTKHSLMEIPARCQTYDRGRPVRTMQPTSKLVITDLFKALLTSCTWTVLLSSVPFDWELMKYLIHKLFIVVL